MEFYGILRNSTAFHASTQFYSGRLEASHESKSVLSGVPAYRCAFPASNKVTPAAKTVSTLDSDGGVCTFTVMDD